MPLASAVTAPLRWHKMALKSDSQEFVGPHRRQNLCVSVRCLSPVRQQRKLNLQANMCCTAAVGDRNASSGGNGVYKLITG